MRRTLFLFGIEIEPSEAVHANTYEEHHSGTSESDEEGGESRDSGGGYKSNPDSVEWTKHDTTIS
jgi:hypothetical protein